MLNAWDSGTFGFNGVFSERWIRGFSTGLPSSYSLNAQPNTIGARRLAFAVFAQDDFHVTNSLTLNLGLRYEGQGAFSEVQNRLSNFSPTLENSATGTPGAILFADANNNTLQANHFKLFAPRIGFAWAPTRLWVARGSYGRSSVAISAQRNYNSTPPGICDYPVASGHKSIQSGADFLRCNKGPRNTLIPRRPAERPEIQNGQSVTYYPFHAAQVDTEQVAPEPTAADFLIDDGRALLCRDKRGASPLSP